jgi:hypothetical protein
MRNSSRASTSFNLWCATALQKTFRQVKNDETFHNLLGQLRIFPDIYETKPPGLQIATRNMNPATSSNEAHWDNFVDGIQE